MNSALVLYGSNNVYALKTDDGRLLEGRIKGKVLKEAAGWYNPLAAGDRVVIEETNPATALITGLIPRQNCFCRWNQKGKSSQILAANVDQVFCLTTKADPPFRPRFLDRILVQADVEGIVPIIVMNKTDLPDEDLDRDERMHDYRNIGYRIIELSAKTGEGMEAFRDLVKGQRSVLVGQSGVGKSTLLNVLDPALGLRTAEINRKYQRGNHTTTMAILHELPSMGEGTLIIDTPGIRRMVPSGVTAETLAAHMNEFAPLLGQCSFGMSCRHEKEPGCKILEAIDAGLIHEDRYESYLRIRDELAGRLPYWEQE